LTFRRSSEAGEAFEPAVRRHPSAADRAGRLRDPPAATHLMARGCRQIDQRAAERDGRRLLRDRATDRPAWRNTQQRTAPLRVQTRWQAYSASRYLLSFKERELGRGPMRTRGLGHRDPRPLPWTTHLGLGVRIRMSARQAAAWWLPRPRT